MKESTRYRTSSQNSLHKWFQISLGQRQLGEIGRVKVDQQSYY
jgi:hypothetical protein